MSKAWLRFAELIALVALGAGMLALAAYMVSLGRMGEAFGNLMGAFLLIIQAIRNIGQAQAMNALAEALGKSQPVDPTREEGSM